MELLDVVSLAHRSRDDCSFYDLYARKANSVAGSHLLHSATSSWESYQVWLRPFCIWSTAHRLRGGQILALKFNSEWSLQPSSLEYKWDALAWGDYFGVSCSGYMWVSSIQPITSKAISCLNTKSENLCRIFLLLSASLTKVLLYRISPDTSAPQHRLK